IMAAIIMTVAPETCLQAARLEPAGVPAGSLPRGGNERCPEPFRILEDTPKVAKGYHQEGNPGIDTIRRGWNYPKSMVLAFVI
ncbi:hypothetical protein, partial [Alkalispirochaeta sphaeroplastigenens]|uniref:hypothetical protein n=1 Tax=Alkalispirochaeta sphaeroplastigenens TaxID=1187066 RepID=UPI001CA49425